MTTKKVSHVVKRPGLKLKDPDYEIPVAEDLATTPGIRQNQKDVDFYSRSYPLESQNIEYTADRAWVWTVYSPEEEESHLEHERLQAPVVNAAATSADVAPTAAPTGKDVTEEIKLKARELGFGEVGMTRYDRRYTFKYKKRWTRFEHAICLAYEQDYERTQSIPSSFAEYTHFGTYRTMSQLGLMMADYIRSLGYHAQVHSPNDNSAPLHSHVRRGGPGTAWCQRAAAFAPLRFPRPSDGNHHGRAGDLRRVGRLRHPQVLRGLPGVREPVSGPRPYEGQGLVERRGEAQAGL